MNYSMRNPLLIVTVSAAAWLASVPSSSQDNNLGMTVHVDDIGAGVTLIGRIGQPLGEMVTLTGVWQYPDELAKPVGLQFHVTTVNERRLDKSVVFNMAQVRARWRGGEDAIPEFKEQRRLVGRHWTMRAYESGRMQVEPLEYRKELGLSRVATPSYFKPFTSELVGVVQNPE